MKKSDKIRYGVYLRALDYLERERYSCHAICAAVGDSCSDHPRERDIYEELFGVKECLFEYEDERVIALMLAHEVFKGKRYTYLR